jgi:hypothetical protein
MKRIRVESLSAEEASFGVAELWAEDAQIAYTIYEDGDLMLRIDPPRDGRPLVVGLRELSVALAEVGRVLAAGEGVGP